jgi:outer membrane immunogenic protein
MTKLPSLVGAAVLFAGPAFAADLVAKPVYKEPLFGWAGFYLGGYAGYAWGSANTTGTLDPNSAFGTMAPNAQPAYNANMSPSLKPKGFTGGGTIGANWQTGAFVWGVEGDFGAFNLSGSTTTSVTPPGHPNLTSNTAVSADWLGTARGRVGLVFDRSLIYVTAGAAFANPSFRQTNTFASLGPTGIENISISGVRVGWGAGAGWEYMFAPNWSGKIDYLHLDFGTLTGVGVVAAQPVNVTHTTTFTADVVRAGVNYRFAP